MVFLIKIAHHDQPWFCSGLHHVAYVPSEPVQMLVLLVRGMAKKPKQLPQPRQVYLPPPVLEGSPTALTLGFRLMSGAVLGSCTVGAVAPQLRSPLQTAGPRPEAAVHRDDAHPEGTPQQGMCRRGWPKRCGARRGLGVWRARLQ